MFNASKLWQVLTCIEVEKFLHQFRLRYDLELKNGSIKFYMDLFAMNLWHDCRK